MDAQSEAMFSRPVVKITGFRENREEIENACTQIFGRSLSPEEIAELIAAPHGAEIDVLVLDEETISLRLGYHWFNGTHNYLFYIENEIRVVEFEEIHVREEAPSALEIRLFAKQVQAFQKFDLDEIRLLAMGHGGDPYWRGYYVWARYGFRMFLRGTEVAGTAYEGIEDTLELFERFEEQGAAEWWEANGSERPAVFYLTLGSDCLAALQAYLQQKGINVDDESNR